MEYMSITTEIVHADRRVAAAFGETHQPIHVSVQYGFERVEDVIVVFPGTLIGGFNYAREGTPTTTALEASGSRVQAEHGDCCGIDPSIRGN
jgi:O-acetylhomoserine (thiol)-lyase